MPLVDFSEEDIRLLQDVVRIAKDGTLNKVLRSLQDDNYLDELAHQAPEVYIGYPQESEGIPELVKGEEGNPDKPGYGTCDIYKIVDNASEEPELIQVDNLDKVVYNLSESVIDQDWLVLDRTKFGRWVTRPPGSGGGNRIRGTIVSCDCNSEPKSAIVAVAARPCGLNSVPGEDEDGNITVYDPMGCVLDQPEADLIDKQIKADYMRVMDSYGEFSCQWEVDFRCCDEDC
jgi:hypothetical protein